MLLSARYILVLGPVLALFLSLQVHAENTTSEELPGYCADYPVIEGELEDYRNDLSSREGEVSHILCHEDQNFSVGVTDILTHWSEVQEVQYDDIRETFEEKLRKGVFKNLAMSTYFYRDLYGPNCDELELSSGPDGEMQRAQCFEQWGMAPSCGEDNEDFEEIFNQVDSDYEAYREQAAQELVVGEEGQEDEEREQALSEAYERLDEKKKISFVRKHVENIIHLNSLREEIEDEQGQKLAELYRQTPLLFEAEDQVLTSDFEISDYAQQLQDRFTAAQGEGEEVSSENIQDFLASEDGRDIINSMASDSELESLAEEALAHEIRNKRGALEDICKGDVENLHRFPSLVEQVMSESIESGEVSEVVADQAAYCYMLQTPASEAESGQGSSLMSKASNFLKGSLMANPILNPFMSIGTGIMMMNAVDEDQESLEVGPELADVQQFTSTEEAYYSSSSWDVDQDEASSQENIELPRLKIRIVGQESQSRIEVAGDQAEFEVEAYFEDDSIEVPSGSFQWECIPPDGEGNEGLCEDSGYSESGESQSVKLFNRVPYVLKADYVVEDGYYPLYIPSAPLRVTLEMECETNDSGTQCVSDEDSRELASTDNDNAEVEEERIREPFWWESLPSNAPPPQFKPGPPMQMRTFILPGAV